jgi:hypothetical protein
MDRIPTLLEELERKTLELLEKEYTRYEAGELSSHDIAIVGKTVWGIVAGLVSPDVMSVCESAANEASMRPLYKTFAGRGNVLSVQYRPMGEAVVVTQFNAKTLEKKVMTHPIVAGELEDYLKKFTQKLVDMEYIQLP